jgi:hypothetical protein
VKLTVDFSALHHAVKNMGAGNIEFQISNKLVPIEPIDKQLNEGLEVNFTDIEFDTGLASYQGRQILLYIKDHSYSNRIYSALEDGSKGNKFHVADCQKLDEMRKKGKLERYVVTNKLDGLFTIIGKDSNSNEFIEGEAKLNVCQFCLETVNYQKFASLQRGAPRRIIVQGFQLADFFDTYSSFFKFMPTGIANVQTSHYTDDWKEVSKKVRVKFDYQCQQCRVDLKQHKSLLHVHHINGVKSDNSSSNLTPLCCDCHRKQPDHQHMFIKHDETKLISHLRNVQGLNTKDSWQDIYDMADPGMHGVINLLEKYHVSLPEVGEKVANDKQEVVAELELAWPLKKVGIAIDKPEAVEASKLGWKVYSMRLALSQMESLAQSLR